MRKKLYLRDIESANEEGIPVYRAEHYEKGKVRLWCPFCCRYHGHGDPEIEHYVLMHRVAHCTTDLGIDRHRDGYYFYVPLDDEKKPRFC